MKELFGGVFSSAVKALGCPENFGKEKWKSRLLLPDGFDDTYEWRGRKQDPDDPANFDHKFIVFGEEIPQLEETAFVVSKVSSQELLL